MKRHVKCVATKESGLSTEFYKAPNGKYFKSEEIYQAWLAGREALKQQRRSSKERTREEQAALTDRVADLIGYKPGDVWPTVVMSCFGELDSYPDSVILQTFDVCDKSLRWAMQNKHFSNDTGKVRYIFAVIRNNIDEINHAEQIRLKQAEALTRTKRNEPSEQDLENIRNTTGAEKTGSDVRSLLGDDLWT